MGMKQFADHILAVANRDQIDVTNLDLQKTMYFVLRNSGGILQREQQEEIYDEPFLAWRYGPVNRTQYFRFSIFGSNPIVGDFEIIDMYNVLNDLIIRILNVNVFKKVEASHSHRFWRDNKERILGGEMGIEYGLDDVLR